MTMKFGGHETFVIREGWLHKGLQLQTDDPELFMQEAAADELGVGRNMAKSIRHWMLATGLSERTEGRRGPLRPTALGELIWSQDPYFLADGTWWALHVELASQPGQAGVWYWFFNHYGSPRFERPACLQSLLQYLQLHRRRLPNRRTLERDLACLFRSYARWNAPTDFDPEEGNESGLVELGLLRHSPATGVYERNTGAKAVPPELIGYDVARAWPEAASGSGTVDIRIDELARQPGGPGRVFQLTDEVLFDELQAAEHSGSEMEIGGLGAERVLRLPRQDSLAWLKRYYGRFEEVGADAA